MIPAIENAPRSNRDAKVRIGAIFPSKILRNLTLQLQTNDTESKWRFQFFKNSKEIVKIDFGGLNDSAFLVEFFTPLESIKILSQVTFKQSSLTIYPNKEWNVPETFVGGRYISGSSKIYEKSVIRSSMERKNTLSKLDILKISIVFFID